MLEPDHTTRVVPTHAGAPADLGSPHALQILMTEHWSLLAARSLGYTESTEPRLDLHRSALRLRNRARARLSSLAMRRPLPVLQPFFSIPGVVAVVDSVVAGAIVGIAAFGLDLGTGWSVALGGIAFAVSLAAFVLWAEHEIARHTARLVVRFPEQRAGQPTS